MKKEKHAYKCRFRSLFPPLLSMIVHQFTCNSCQLQASTPLLEVVCPQQSGGYVKHTLPHTEYIIHMVETTETSSTVLE